VTERKSAVDRLLELAVFGPAGLAVTVVEEFPKLVDKGRHRVEGQVHTARLVGQVAVQMGRRQVEQAIDRLGGGPSTPPAAPAPSPPTTDTGGHGAPEPPVASPPRSSPQRSSSVGTGGRPAPQSASSVTTAESTAPQPPSPAPPSVAGNGSGPPPTLAIPGYDSLSASQVVQRLEGLSAGELEEVRAHESAHRHRRTILHRVEQLLTGADGAGP
jgi:hypothetical protein